MEKNTNEYAIALEHSRIALLKRLDELQWEAVDSVDIGGMPEADIPSAFAPFAKKWFDMSSTVSVCLPSDVVIHATDKEPAPHEKLFNDHKHTSPETHYIFSKDKPNFTYAIFEIEHINLTHDFLGKFGFKISQIGYCDAGLDMCSPIFFDYQQFTSSQPRIKNTSQLELDQKTKQETFSTVAHKPEISPQVIKQNKRKYLIIALALLSLFIVFLWWWLQPQRDTEVIASETPEITLETPNIEPEISVDQIEQSAEDRNALPPPDFDIINRPTDHNTHVNNIEESRYHILVQLPDFTIIPRPLEHGGTSENQTILNVITNDGILASQPPAARPNILNIPPPAPALRLIGISGASRNPGALIQSADNDFQTVNVGDNVDGWQIKAISKKEVIIVRNGQSETLTVPSD